MLSDKTKAETLRISRELLECFEKEGEDLKKIIIGNETCVHHYDPENKRQSMEYHHKESPQPKKFKTQVSAGKVMLTVFWNSERVILADFLEKETLNPQHYIETLAAFKRRSKRIGIINETLLQHDARPHTSAATRDAIQRLDFSLLPHPPYSPDLAPGDFHLIPKLKEHLKGQHFSCDEEVKSALRKCFQKQNTDFFKDRFKKTSAALVEVY